MGITKGEDTPVRGHHEVAPVVMGWHHADDGRVEAVRKARACGMEADSGYRSVELGVSIAEDAAVRGVEPVPAVVGRGHDADHGELQVQAPGRPVELGLTKGE